MSLVAPQRLAQFISIDVNKLSSEQYYQNVLNNRLILGMKILFYVMPIFPYARTQFKCNNFTQEKQIKAIADSGAKVVVSGGKIGDMALHFLNKYGLMAVRLNR